MNVRLIYHVVRLWIARHVHCEANSRSVAISLNLRRTHRLGLRRLDFFDRPLICLPAGGPHIAPAAELYRQDKGHPHLLAGRCEPPAAFALIDGRPAAAVEVCGAPQRWASPQELEIKATHLAKTARYGAQSFFPRHFPRRQMWATRRKAGSSPGFRPGSE